MDAAGLELLRRLTNETEGWSDAFENQVTARTNVLDLAAHYPYSPERWRDWRRNRQLSHGTGLV